MPKPYDTKAAFTDPAAELAVLAAVQADPALFFRLKDFLPPDAFAAYGGSVLTSVHGLNHSG